MKKLHLLCNAHLDPVWQWEWEEGAAAAVSTFRAAADFCEEFEEFVFNHNEAILYRWIEEYEPLLFQRIRDLVKQGRWHIIGGWYLQPDCNMPSGESFVRQILIGNQYFYEKFGVKPTTAVNFDSFGHTRGLVQILEKAGYDSYVFQRPEKNDLSLPDEDFVWVGCDGSKVIGHRLYSSYNSLLGKAADKIRSWIKDSGSAAAGMLAWGVGNHGGGPSRLDLTNIRELIKESTSIQILHSTPENYIQDRKESKPKLPEFHSDLFPKYTGCFTTQIRIKQRYRLLENELYMTEKMASGAAAQGLIKYPEEEMREALYDLMTSQFHDILPGTSVQPVEETSLRIMDHGLEIVSKIKARAFFALSSGQPAASEGEIPILVYNPHPFYIEKIVECEFMLADQNWEEEFSLPTVFQEGRRLPSQPEKENSNINLDWRKKVVFHAILKPSQMSRFDVRLEKVPHKPKPTLRAQNGRFIFVTEELYVEINADTGLMDTYRVRGVDYLKKDAFMLLVVDDTDDSWGGSLRSFRNVIGRFSLMSLDEGTYFSGTWKPLESVRVIEDGEVRTIVEVLLKYNNSRIVQRYKLPKQGTEIQVELRVFWNENSKMLKLSVPTAFFGAEYSGQTAFGIRHLPTDGDEGVQQKWSAVIDKAQKRIFSCINEGVYGSDFKEGEMRISLLRSPGYTCFDLSQAGMDRDLLPKDRFSPRIDQGERLYSFWFNGGTLEEAEEHLELDALMHNEKPYALSFFPSGNGMLPQPSVVLENSSIQMSAFKKAESSGDYIIRMYESTGKNVTTRIWIPYIGVESELSFGKFEIKTLKINAEKETLEEIGLLENDLEHR